jgi:hypothetical protein
MPCRARSRHVHRHRHRHRHPPSRTRVAVPQLLLGDLLADVPPNLRPPIMATVAVPIVVYAVMPRLAPLTARVARG